MTETDAVAAFAALSSATRLAILRKLVAAGPAGMAAGAVAQVVDASPSRASFHLSALQQAGLVHADRDARSILYRARFDTLGALMLFLLEECCQNAPQVRACCGLPAKQ